MANSKGLIIKAIKSFVTCFGLGLMPVGPGTFGSLFGLAIVLILSYLTWPVYFIATIFYCALCLWAVAVYLQDSESKDPKEVVADEVLGILVTFFLVPVTALSLFFGFIMFRFFDIFKPPPISFFDRKVPGATGVMADDVVAGLIVNMIFHFLILPYGLLEKVSESVSLFMN